MPRISISTAWLLITVALLGWMGCADKASPEATSAYAGFWEARKPTQNGIGALFHLESDGTARTSLVVMLQGAYTKQGDQLTVTMDADTGESEPLALSWKRDGAALVIEHAGGTEQRYQAVDVPDAAGLVGAWRSKHYTGGNAYERFEPHGGWAFRLWVAPGRSGHWTRTEDGVAIQFDADEPKRYRVSPDDPAVLVDADGHALHRIDTHWYAHRR